MPKTATEQPTLNGPELLEQVKSDLKDLHTILDTRFNNGFVMDHIKQSLQGVITGIDQELRNVKIDAEMESKRAAGLIK